MVRKTTQTCEALTSASMVVATSHGADDDHRSPCSTRAESVLCRVSIGACADAQAADRLDDDGMKVEKLMTRDVVTVAPDTPLKAVAGLLSSRHISGAPVCDAEGAIVGVISEADVLRKEQGISPDAGRRFHWLFRLFDGELDKVCARTAGEAMTAPALTVRPYDDASAAARLMVDRRINRLPVVAGGALVGIVTRADFVRVFSRSDEELSAEIRDELFDQILWIDPDSLGLEIKDGVVTVQGSVDTHADAEAVVSYIRRIPGVLEVHSSLQSRDRDGSGSRL
jgi:CBS domain-containing protein